MRWSWPTSRRSLLVVGGGIIGLEMANVFRALGSEVTVVELIDQLMPGADADLVKPLAARLKKQGAKVHLKTKVVASEAKKAGIDVAFEGESIPERKTFDRVLVAVGRSANGGKLDAARQASTSPSAASSPSIARCAPTCRTSSRSAISSVTRCSRTRPRTKEAWPRKSPAGMKREWVARVIPSVAYTDPEIAWVGVTETEAAAKGLKVGVGKFPWAASGRAIGIDRTEGFTKLVFDEATHRVIGGGIVGVHAGDLISEIALAIEMGADAEDIGSTIHPHPTLSESVGFAAEVFEGTVTDIYAPKKK